MIRNQRGQRLRKSPRVEITERDEQILLLVGLTGYLSTEQLARESFPTLDRCQKRLRQLFNARLINLTLWASTKPNLVSLTPQGLKLLQERRPEMADRLRLVGVIRLSGIKHHLLTADCRLYLSALLQKENGSLLQWDNGRGSLSSRLRVKEHKLVPDGMAEAELDGQRMIIAFEIDCGTEGGKALEAKLRRYKGLFQAGEVDELWIIVSGGKERQETLTYMAKRAELGEVCRVMSTEQIRRKPVERPGERAGKCNGLSSPYSTSSASQYLLSIQSLGRSYPASERRVER